jgi:hypothetical protein
MVSYFYKWVPIVIVGTVIILSLPWLGLIALMVVLLAVVAALAWAIVSVPYMLSRAISGRGHGRIGESPQIAAALHVHGQPHEYAALPRVDYRKRQP